MSRVESIESFDHEAVLVPMAGQFQNKSLLSIKQLEATDIEIYLEEAEYAGKLLGSDEFRGAVTLPNHVLGAVMRQPSTRTGGSMRTAMSKLGGTTGVISGMTSSSEAKGETLADSWLAFATQFDLIGTRTSEEYGPHYADYVIRQALQAGKLDSAVPIINLGDGRNEHPTQTLGDLRTIKKQILDRGDGRNFSDLTIAFVGDHERYRAFHSLMIAAGKLGMNIVAVESKAAPVPQEYVDRLGSKLETTDDLNSAIIDSDIVYVGRNPEEYNGKNKKEAKRSRMLSRSYASWRIDQKRLNLMRPDGILMHPRPRRDEIDPAIDSDPRVVDVMQMRHMIPTRMAVISLACGRSIMPTVNRLFNDG